MMILALTRKMNWEKNEKVRQREKFIREYQQPLPGSAEGEKWKLMHTIFELQNF